MAVEPAAAAGQVIGIESQPLAPALQPLGDPPLVDQPLVDQPPDAIPKPSPQHRAQQPGQHGGHQLEAPLVHQIAPVGHHHLRGDRRNEVFQQHHQGNGAVAQPWIGLHGGANHVGEAFNKGLAQGWLKGKSWLPG